MIGLPPSLRTRHFEAVIVVFGKENGHIVHNGKT